MKLAALMLFLAACGQRDGTRCNPLQFSGNGVQGDCRQGYACVYPTAPTCGVAYCCAVDDAGNVTDPSPACQPDSALQLACGVDLGVVDASEAD